MFLARGNVQLVDTEYLSDKISNARSDFKNGSYRMCKGPTWRFFRDTLEKAFFP